MVLLFQWTTKSKMAYADGKVRYSVARVRLMTRTRSA